MYMNIGIFPGTFDPIHEGHISFSLLAARQHSLDKVMFLPEPSPREKTKVSHIDQREQWARDVTDSYPSIDVVRLRSKQFSVAETLPFLEQKFPDATLHLLLGSDVVKTFSYRWPGVEVLLARMPLIVGLRAGDSRESIEAALLDCQTAFGVTITYHILDSPHPHIASSYLPKNRT